MMHGQKNIKIGAIFTRLHGITFKKKQYSNYNRSVSLHISSTNIKYIYFNILKHICQVQQEINSQYFEFGASIHLRTTLSKPVKFGG
jgi:hypothetical protein